MEAKVGLEVLGDFTDQALERQLADEEFRALLVAADFAEGDGSRAVTVGLLDATLPHASRKDKSTRLVRRAVLGLATLFADTNVHEVVAVKKAAFHQSSQPSLQCGQGWRGHDRKTGEGV